MILSPEEIRKASSRLKPILERMQSGKDAELQQMLVARDEVIPRFQPIFSPENIASLTAEEFHSFLLLKNNRHWSGLQRHGGSVIEDMDLLCETLTILVDESRPIEDRLDEILPKSGAKVKHLGRAILTPILLVTYPDRYGVMNTPSTEGMVNIGIDLHLDPTLSFGRRYREFNEVLKALANECEIDLWTLDAVWWRVIAPSDGGDGEPELPIEQIEGEPAARFGLEKYLQEFMRDNWEHVPQLKAWALHEVDGETVGYEYNTKEIGRIDLLAHHRKEPKWLVIELKRNQTSDDTIGQVLRYMGWASEKLAKPGEEVEGMVICHAGDTRMRYALKYTHGVKLVLYEVQFRLQEA